MTRNGLESGPRTQSGAEGDVSNGAAYDFERLERAVAFLLEEHERLSSEKEELLSELVDREQRLTSLESQLSAERERRSRAVEAVDKMLGRLAQLQASVGEAMESA